MITNLGETSALDIHSRRIMDINCSNRWNNFLLLTRNQTRSHLPFETHNWTNSDNTADMETSCVETNATIVCSTMSDHCDNAQLKKRQRLHMSKHILLIDFLEDLDTDWEITTQYEYQHYVDESSGNFQHSMNVSEEIDDNILSDIAMGPTDDEDEYVIQAKKYADLLFTRCRRTLNYLETLKTDEWEIATLSDLNSNESSRQLESKTDHDMFNSENGSCLSEQKTIGKITKRPKNTGFARSLDEEFQRVSVENDDLIIPSSSIESENDEENEPPICLHIKQIEDCSVQVGCRNFNEEKTVTDQNLATGTEAVSPDDPLGFQHLTWQESNSSSDASVSASASQWDVTQQVASPVPTMPQALKKHRCFAVQTGPNALLRRTIHNNASKTSVPTNAKHDPFDVSYVEDDGDSTFEKLFTKRQSTTKVVAQKTAKKTKKKKNTTVPNASVDIIETNIISILQNTHSSFDEASYTNKNKIVKKDVTPKIIKTSKKSLTQIVKTSVRDVIKSIMKSRRNRGFRRSAPIRKMVLKKMFVPKRKPCEDKSVQVVFSEDKSTNTHQIPVDLEQKASIDKEVQVNCKKTNAKPKRRTKGRKGSTEETAASTSQNLLNVKLPNSNQPSVKKPRRKTRIYTKPYAADPVSVNTISNDRQHEFDGNSGYKQTKIPQYMHRINESGNQWKKQRVSNVLPNMTRPELKPTKACYRSPQYFNTQPSIASKATSSNLLSSTIYCPHATIVCCGNDNENTFCRRIDELRLCGMQSDISYSQIIPSSHMSNEHIQRPGRKLYGTRMLPVDSFSASETLSSDDLPDFGRTPLFDDVLEPIVGPYKNLESYPEEYAQYIEARLLEDLKGGTLKTLPELYGNEAQTICHTEFLTWFWPAGKHESCDSGMNMSGTFNYDKTGNTDGESAMEDNKHVQSGLYTVYCSSIKGSQEPSRFSPGFSPIRFSD